MANVNKAILVGRLTANPELKQTTTGLSVVQFTVAVNRKFDKDKADFLKCVAWRDRAEFIERYFAKGSQIYLEGTIQTREYEDKEKNKRTATEIVVDEVQFVDSKGDGVGGKSKPYAPTEAQTTLPKAPPKAPNVPSAYKPDSILDNMEEVKDDDDLPF